LYVEEDLGELCALIRITPKDANAPAALPHHNETSITPAMILFFSI
jgi:hypothetical protein